MKRQFLASAAIALLAACRTPDNGVPLKMYRDHEPFVASELKVDLVSTPQDCATLADAVWVVVQGQGDCIRYYPSWLDGARDNAIFAMSGDFLATSLKMQVPVPGYVTTPGALREISRGHRDRQQVSFVTLARPGMWGSSGAHAKRRQHRETLLAAAAIAAIGQKEKLTEIAVVGQSGGGGLAMSILTILDDINCAVSASGAVAVNLRNMQNGSALDATGLTPWDPYDHIQEIRKNPNLRMFFVGDTKDRNVPFNTQVTFADKARSFGYQTATIEVNGTGSQSHSTLRQGIAVAADCLKGLAPDAIVAKHWKT